MQTRCENWARSQDWEGADGLGSGRFTRLDQSSGCVMWASLDMGYDEQDKSEWINHSGFSGLDKA